MNRSPGECQPRVKDKPYLEVLTQGKWKDKHDVGRQGWQDAW